jgi:SAM-dependent methyltransferase
MTIQLEAIKEKQQKTWASGNYAVIGNSLVIMGELLCEAVDVRSGQKVLDVATGSGNTAISAAWRYCGVTGIDYVPELIQQAKERAGSERLGIAFEVGDAENLPYPDASFDVVLSTPYREGHTARRCTASSRGPLDGVPLWRDQLTQRPGRETSLSATCGTRREDWGECADSAPLE